MVCSRAFAVVPDQDATPEAIAQSAPFVQSLSASNVPLVTVSVPLSVSRSHS